MIKTILFAGALLASGATMSSASAALYHVNPAFRSAVAYHRPVRPVRSFGAAVGYRAPIRPARFAVPLSKRASGRFVRPASAFNRFTRPTYAYHRMARPAYGYRRLAHRGYNPVTRPAAPAVAAQPAATILGGLLPLVAPSPAAIAPARVAVAPARAAVALRRTIALGGGQVGGASYYSGRRTASGGSVGGATCAHRWLPFGTRLLVTNLFNARRTMCVVNDRGPFVGGRIVDLSRGAAGAIGMIGSGVASVRVTVVGRS